MKQSSKTKDSILTALSAALITLCAWISIPSAVPFTMQTFAVALSGALMGAKRGAMSAIIYILLGIIGLPVFAGFRSGASVILGATGGYTLGFIFFAAICGFFCRRFKRTMPVMLLSMTAGLISCYTFGTLWYMCIYLSEPQSLSAVLSACVIPFVIPDIIKIFLAAICVKKAEKFVE